ncbi:inactive hydroxysteroid dehydrogenase-like protein 1 [Pelobates fuscus]|uniref:inactive hydroxysteroid dehydrogenase-like protein 1 n=1 Tax=Pelobates fuscus TaxID=191477 RepID=UPI002FE49C85
MAAVDSFHLLYREVAKSCQSHVEVLTVIGACYVTWKGLRTLYECCSLFQLHVTPCLIRRTSLTKQYGEWAVVTGAAEGIGKAYAEELARKGLNVFLIGGNKEKLQVVSQSIAKTHRVKTSFIEADFNKGREVYPPIKEALANLNIGILVNSAAYLEYPQRVTEVLEDKLWEIINVNVAAATMMVHIVVPGMVQRKKGAIVNVCCCSCCRSAMYSASKVYLDAFSQELQSDLSHKGIFVQSLIPLCVATNCTTSIKVVHRLPFLVPAPETYARHAVRTLGVSTRTTGYWVHSIELLAAQWIPSWMYLFLGRFLCSSNL